MPITNFIAKLFELEDILLGKRTVARVQQIFLQLGDENCGEGRDRDRNDGG